MPDHHNWPLALALRSREALKAAVLGQQAKLMGSQDPCGMQEGSREVGWELLSTISPQQLQSQGAAEGDVRTHCCGQLHRQRPWEAVSTDRSPDLDSS